MSKFPSLRMRRLRATDSLRRLATETVFGTNDLIWPVFVHGLSASEPVSSLPGVSRLSFDDLWRCGERALQLKIPMLALFPVIDAQQKDAQATAADNPDGLLMHAVRGLKSRFPELSVMTDIALDPYTSHGHDGIIDTNGRIQNDETVAVLRRQALAQAQAGADVLAPSDMMDGRIGAIRQALEDNGFYDTVLLAYAAKYASAFYGPFRAAIGSSAALGNADKRTYQMNPANAREAMREIALDLQEGADMVMVKPGMPYLDIISMAVRTVDAPVLAYQVSGEYAMLKAAAANGWLAHDACMMEGLLAFRRAGARAVLTYFAAEAAAWLAENTG